MSRDGDYFRAGAGGHADGHTQSGMSSAWRTNPCAKRAATQGARDLLTSRCVARAGDSPAGDTPPPPRLADSPKSLRVTAIIGFRAGSYRPTSRPLALVPYRNARVIIQVGAGASPSSKLQPVNNSAAIFRLPYWYGNGTRIAPPRIARSCRATTGVRLSGGDDASEIKRILQMQTPVKSLL